MPVEVEDRQTTDEHRGNSAAVRFNERIMPNVTSESTIAVNRWLAAACERTNSI